MTDHRTGWMKWAVAKRHSACSTASGPPSKMGRRSRRLKCCAGPQHLPRGSIWWSTFPGRSSFAPGCSQQPGPVGSTVDPSRSYHQYCTCSRSVVEHLKQPEGCHRRTGGSDQGCRTNGTPYWEGSPSIPPRSQGMFPAHNKNAGRTE